MSSPLLSFDRVRRTFGAFTALESVSLDVFAGRVTAVVGENGAGKSTLMRIAAGEIQPDDGALQFDGRPLVLRSPREASARGIAMVHQHFMLVPHFTVAENLALARAGKQLLGRSAYRRIYDEARETTALALPPPDRLVQHLSVGEKSRVELAKALAGRPRLLILDEPSSVLTPAEADELGSMLRTLAAAGVAVVLVTHKLREVFAYADEVVVLRRGSVALRAAVSDTTAAAVATAMVGTLMESTREAAGPAGEEVTLALRSVSTPGAGSDALRNVSLELRAGEIAAIAGVAGNGQRSLARVLRGLEPFNGTVVLAGLPLSRSDLLRTARVGHIPPDRSVEGVVGELSIAENLRLATPGTGVERTARELIERFRIAARGPRQRADRLSGGNQQKLLLARELARKPLVLVASDPTRGLDFAAIEFMHERLREVARQGTAVLLITSDLDEAAALASSIRIMFNGSLSEPLPPLTDPRTLGMQMAGVPA